MHQKMQEENYPVDQVAITHVIEHFVDAWNRHDARDFTALFTRNAEWIDVLGRVAQGQAEIEREHTFAFSTILKQAILTLRQRRIKWIRPDVVTVGLTWESTGNQTPDGKPLPMRHGQATMVVTKEEGHWLIVAGHNVDYTATYRQADHVG